MCIVLERVVARSFLAASGTLFYARLRIFRCFSRLILIQNTPKSIYEISFIRTKTDLAKESKICKNFTIQI